VQFRRVEGNVGTNLDRLGDLDANAGLGTVQNLSGRRARFAGSPIPLQFNERVREGSLGTT
jgi:hypothetical protein